MADAEATIDPVTATITRLLAGPARPGQAFTMPGCNYDALYRMARRLKACFKDFPDENASIFLFTEDRAVMAAAMLAALAGGPQILLPYALSEATLLDLHRLTGFSAIIGKIDGDPPDGVRIIDPETLTDEVETLAPNEEPAPDRPWVRLFTGGSTGSPQLWTKTPRNLLGEVNYLLDRFGINSGDRILATVPAFHIYGLLYSLLAPLLASARVSALSPSFPEEIKQKIAEMSPTIFVSVPIHYRALKDNPPDKGALRLAFSSAGPLPEDDGRAFFESTGVDLVEIYGSTETGGIATRCRKQGEAGFIPYDCIQWRVAGEELDIRSAFLSAELPVRESGWFTMADRVKTENGGFVVVGRADNIVKVGGNRVDLEKVRQAIAAIEGVREAMVLSNPADTGRNQEIVALAAGSRTAAEIQERLVAVLMPHERPRRVIMVDKIPMAATGKPDRQVIRKMFQTPRNRSESSGRQVLQGTDGNAIGKSYPADSPIRRLTVAGRPPALKTGNRPESLLDWLAAQVEQPCLAKADMASLRQLSRYRRSLTDFTLVVHEETGIQRIIEGAQPASLGFAVDLGTTALVGYLCDLQTGEVLAAETLANPQQRFGEDVTSRISAINETPEHLEQMQQLAAEGINLLMTRCLEKVGSEATVIDEVAVCGNTTMQQIFTGLHPCGLDVSPNFPLTLTPPAVSAGSLGLAVDPTVPVFLMPVVSGFVGGDTMAAVMADRPHEREETTLIVDLGANGKMVLGNDKRLWATGFDTGPAPEGVLGAGIEVLMRKAGIATIDRVILTGALGCRFDWEHALAIGMLPPAVAQAEILPADNLAGVGVVMALLDKKIRLKARDLCRRIRYLEIASNH
ncbi:AMP-binding protein [uncultured Desulfosarcina sp.]|uniref:AMP-binding protein n=1 Tax=uncultured Desulfosarcina sp. TaxID=218289 RepID=UPI0029C6D8C6|nr:AMP-binding protein [uncultured Desulfosarcina sp.]